jgi:hypothetical protein
MFTKSKGVDSVKTMKKRISSRVVLAVVLLATTLALAAPKPPKANAPQNVPSFPGTLANARYVYVTSYDGDQFNINLLPEDRQAIGAVEDALQKWGKFTLVYEPNQADFVLMVMSRPSEDVLAVYDAHGWPGNQYLWRMMGRGGLEKSEAPLLANLEKAFDRVTVGK